MDYQEFSSHFPKMISKSLVQYVTDTVLKNSRYLFFKTEKGIQVAYCTHCNRQHCPKEKLKHKQTDKVKCPHCRSLCKVRAAGISRKYMKDRAVLVWYEKSVLNPKAITARVISVYRDYSGEFKNVETMYNCSDMYLFEPGSSTYYLNRRQKAASIYSAFDRYFGGYGTWPKYRSDNNIRKAVKGTPFQYSTWEHYTRFDNPRYVSDMVEFFDLAARYPCVEYLTKAGFEKFVWAKLYKHPTYGAINWRGKTVLKVLRLSKAELKDLRTSGLEISPLKLRSYQTAKAKGYPVSIQEAFLLADIHGGMSKTYYKEAIKLAPETSVIKFLLKQLKKEHFSEVYDVLRDWDDYRKQCKQLQMSLKEERYLFPNDLHTAHLKLTKRIKIKEDKVINDKISLRLPELNKYEFEYAGLFIRPACSSIELFEEGKCLNHCVGQYAEQYAKGESDLFFIRKVEEPDKPYYTMEVQKGKVLQCRGFENGKMTPEVKEFVDKFVSTKFQKKRRTRVKNNEIRQGAAV